MRRRTSIAVLGLGLGMPVAAGAQVINFHDAFNYAGYISSTASNYTADTNWASLNYAGQGAYSDPGNNTWNGFGVGNSTHPVNFNTSSGHNLSSSGTPTSVGLTTTYSGGDNGAIYNFADNAGGNTLQGKPAFLLGTAAVANGTDPTETFVLDHVPAGTYKLYLYGANYDNDRGTLFAVNSGTADMGITGTLNGNPTHDSNLVPAPSFVEGANYVVFNNVVPDSNGNITITATPNPADGVGNANLPGEADVNGLQLINTTAAAIPEPASLGLLCLGGTGLLTRRRRRS